MTDAPKTAVLVVNRQNDGAATYSLIIDGEAQALSSSSAHWDDASPWAAGTYGMTYEPFHGRWPAWRVDGVAGRSAIKVHRGTRTDHSQGCIVLPQAMIDEILSVLAQNDIRRSDLTLQVGGTADFGFRIESKNSQVKEGGKIEVEISLTGAMSADGVSKDIWVHVNPDGTAELNTDFAPTNPQKLPAFRSSSSYPVDGPGFWVKIPEGQSKVSFTVDVKKDKLKEQTETVKFQIDGYKVVNNTSRGPEFYTPSNYRTILNQVLYNRDYVQIKDNSTDLNLSESGGYEGFSRTVAVAAGSDINLNFDAYGIPDKLKIWDASTGTVYVDWGYGSNTYASSFTVDEAS
ncbi:MAG: hypothetical protein DI640_13945, partial [Sphingomonas taxi]